MSGNSIRNNTSGHVYRFWTALVNDVFVRIVGSSSKMSRAVLRSIGIHAASGQNGGCLGLPEAPAEPSARRFLMRQFRTAAVPPGAQQQNKASAEPSAH